MSTLLLGVVFGFTLGIGFGFRFGIAMGFRAWREDLRKRRRRAQAEVDRLRTEMHLKWPDRVTKPPKEYRS